MNTNRIRIKIVALICLLALACATVPVTGRRQLLLISGSNLNSMSFQQYSDFLNSHKVSSDTESVAMVKRAGKKIQRAVEDYFRIKGTPGALAGYAWEFNLVEDSLVNAWCMPGGKVVVYTGILDVAQSESGLAVVMGHEIAHAIANHGNERMSHGMLAQMGGMALSAALKEKPEETQQLFMAAFGMGAQLGLILPYSRLHESEADQLGLIFMAKAGYDPREAVSFWQRMAEMKSGSGPPEFLSTHPSDQTRIDKIRKLLPEALTYYESGK